MKSPSPRLSPNVASTSARHGGADGRVETGVEAGVGDRRVDERATVRSVGPSVVARRSMARLRIPRPLVTTGYDLFSSESTALVLAFSR